MNALVLIGLGLIVAGLVLLAVRFTPRMRRQFAATATQPRTVADLVRLREETGGPRSSPPPAGTASAMPAPAAPGRAGTVPAAPTHQPAPAARAAQFAAAPPVPKEPAPPPPAFAAPRPAAPASGWSRREPQPAGPPLPPPLDGGDAPWQRGARMAAGLGGGQPWREPPTPPTPLRIVPSTEPAPAQPAQTAPAGQAPARLVPARPALAAEAAVEPSDAQSARADDADDPVGHPPARLVPAELPAVAPEEQPASIESPPEVGSDATGPVEAVDPGDPGAAAGPEPAEPERPEPAGAECEMTPEHREIPIPGEWDETEPEDVPAGAVPDRFAEPVVGERVAGRRSRRTPDELAAEQAAADLALLRTFGFVDPGLRPDSAPVVAMASPEAEEPPAAGEGGQFVRYRVIRRDGSVVGGAAVTLLDDRGGDVASGTADAAGRGAVQAPTSGGYVLVSTAAGHQPGAVAITVADAAADADVVLARSASVSGAVHGEDGPIASARVTLVQDGEAVDAVDTDADGAYRIDDIGAGEYGLSVAAAGCEPVATLLDVAEEADIRHDVTLVPASPVADADGDRDDDLDGDLVGDDAMSGRR